jgi:hypothetical protein
MHTFLCKFNEHSLPFSGPVTWTLLSDSKCSTVLSVKSNLHNWPNNGHQLLEWSGHYSSTLQSECQQLHLPYLIVACPVFIIMYPAWIFSVSQPKVIHKSCWLDHQFNLTWPTWLGNAWGPYSSSRTEEDAKKRDTNLQASGNNFVAILVWWWRWWCSACIVPYLHAIHVLGPHVLACLLHSERTC